MKVYKVSIVETLPRRHFAERREYWYFTNKRAAKLQYKKVCQEHNYVLTRHENYNWRIVLLHRVNNLKGYNILEVELYAVNMNKLPKHDIEYIGGYTI